jgi:hypothetical protein
MFFVTVKFFLLLVLSRFCLLHARDASKSRDFVELLRAVAKEL